MLSHKQQCTLPTLSRDTPTLSEAPAFPAQELLAPERRALVAHLPGVLGLLEFMLVRDPLRRPTLADALHRCAYAPDKTSGALASISSTRSLGLGYVPQNVDIR